MARNAYRQLRFEFGAHDLKQLPPDGGIEVAFAGRSNAGKSSALNAIADQKALARTSKAPGRTQQINYFPLDDARRVVDLPGYGYAKVPEALRRHWQQTLGRFLETRQALRGLVLVMDVRRPLTDYDMQMLDWCHHRGMPVHCLLTKADKLKHGRAQAMLQAVRKDLADEYGDAVTVQLFSALKKQGVEEARAVLDRWFGLDAADGGD